MRLRRMKDGNGRWPGRLWRRVGCSLSGAHDPVHCPLGGFRCSRCGKSGADLEQLGFEDEGFVTEAERLRLAQAGEDTDQAC